MLKTRLKTYSSYGIIFHEVLSLKKQLNNETALVCKHNNLINAKYKLNSGEQKLVLAISSMVNPKDKEFKEYSLSVSEFAELMDIDINKNSGLYSRLKRKSSLLLSKRLTIHEPDGDLQTTWFASIKYFDKEGVMSFCIAPRLKKYYLQLQQFTKYRLKNISSLNSQHSIRIYELLKQYEKLKIRVFQNLDDFKISIGLEPNQYPRFYDLKKYALLVAQRELAEKTDISFDFEPIKKGRTITGIKFYIYSNKAKIINEPTGIDELSMDMSKGIEENDYIENTKSIIKNRTSTEINDKLASEIYKCATQHKEYGNAPLELINEVAEYSTTQSINTNFGRWFKTTVKNFERPIKSIKNTQLKFNNFEGRGSEYYGNSDLEKKLLGWDNEEEN